MQPSDELLQDALVEVVVPVSAGVALIAPLRLVRVYRRASTRPSPINPSQRSARTSNGIKADISKPDDLDRLYDTVAKKRKDDVIFARRGIRVQSDYLASQSRKSSGFITSLATAIRVGPDRIHMLSRRWSLRS
jgi:hypothetical protein